MSQAVRVKGSSLLSKLDFVERRFGSAARQALEERMAERFMAPLLPSFWYPFELYVELLDAIVAEHFGGDVESLRDLGADSAEQALQGMYRSFLRDRIDAFLEGLPQLHRMFYDHGKMMIQMAPEGDGCDIQLRDWIVSKEDRLLTAGFYQRAAELHGCQGVDCQVRQTDEDLSYSLRWTS